MGHEPLRLMLVPKIADDEIFARNRADPENLKSILLQIATGFDGTLGENPSIALPDPWTFTGLPRSDHAREGPEHPVSLTVSLSLKGEALRSWLVGYAEYLTDRTGAAVQSDLPLASTRSAPSRPFGTRTQASRLIGIDRLTPGPDHGRVNVVIVDQGFDGTLFPGRFGGGFEALGRAPGRGSSPHAAMIARIVHTLAPDAFLYDCPLIPTPAPGARAVLNDLPAFTSDAVTLCREISFILKLHASIPGFGSWIFVNPWTVFDRRSDKLAPHYATDRAHALNQAIVTLVGQDADIVFSAGNCGQFAPDRRCGKADRGPCRSILGANSLDDVLTVGAVRTDATPLAYSSQGPGQPGLASGTAKPDVYAPSQFVDDEDRLAIFSGTSAAAAVAGAVIAALRTGWSASTVPPAAMKDALVASARPIPGLRPGQGVGTGLIDAAAAASRLLANPA